MPPTLHQERAIDTFARQLDREGLVAFAHGLGGVSRFR